MKEEKGRRGPDGAVVEAFVERWRDTGGKERSNYQLFLTELCRLLGLPGPEPAGDDPAGNTYVFERALDPAERHKLGAHYTPRRMLNAG